MHKEQDVINMNLDSCKHDGFKIRFITCFLLSAFTFYSHANPNRITTNQTEQAQKLVQNKPVKFLENKGQMMDMEGNPVPFVLFKVEAPGINIFITEEGLTWQTLKIKKEGQNDQADLKQTIKPEFEKANHSDRAIIEWERIDILLKGANIKKENVLKEISSETNFNFFYPHCDDGIYGVKEYEKITIKDVYPGIDWVFYNSSDKGFKYDFIVNPGADHKLIELIYKSKSPVQINSKGEIELNTLHGNITENAPISFLDGKEIPSQFIRNYQKQAEINGDKGFETSISFHFSSPLFKERGPKGGVIIDPQLIWATFYGGSANDILTSVDTDDNGNVFVTGYTSSANFPTQTAGTYFQGANAGSSDVFILKFSNAGALLWATYYGGSGADQGNFITTDASGNVFLTGSTGSSNFPVLISGTFFQGTSGGARDIFILKFDNTGARLWGTYYGGNADDVGNAIAVDGTGNIFLTGYTESANFPLQNAGTFFQNTLTAFQNVIILKFTNTGARVWATYYGGTALERGNCITTDAAGNIFITGITGSSDFPTQNSGTFFQGTIGAFADVFILKFDNLGNRLWATLYGGTGGGGEMGNSIVTDGNGNIFVCGYTRSNDFPLQNAGTFFQGTLNSYSDAFLLKFDNVGNRLWGTFYGGTGDEYFGTFDHLAVDGCDNLYVSLYTGGLFISGTILPVQSSCDAGYYDNSYNDNNDIGILLFDNSGNRLWATFFGGNDFDFTQAVAVDGNNNLFVAGEWGSVTNSLSYPVTNPGGGAYYDPTFNGGTNGGDGVMAKFRPTPIIANTTATQPSCSNPCGGSATANVVSPSACTYSYLWSNSQTTQTVTGLCAGNYTVTVTNQLCSDTSLIVTINAASGSLTLNTSSTAANCGSNNGTASVTASGGTNPLTYNWSNGQTTSTATGLSAGTFTATVTDATGCSNTQTVTIASSGTLSVTISSTQAGCTVNNGTATVNPGSGTAPYTYNWSNGQTTTTTTGLGVGNYTATVTDANGCTTTETVTITQSPAFTVSVTTNTASCLSSNGDATATPSGGTPGFSYSWNNGQTTQTATGLSAGTYTVTITDAAGCTQTALANISNTGSPQANISSATNVLCNGGSNGSLTVNVTVGTAPYTYSWNPSGQTTSAATNLSAGNYVVTVTDALGCIVIVSDTVTEPAPITTSATSTNTNCTGSTGTANVTASGGTPSYSYSWNNGQTTQTATGLSTGNYTATITDANGCTKTETVTVASTNISFSVSATSTQTGCTVDNGTATANPSNGTAPYSYNWNNGQTTQTTTGLGSGTYTATVTDGNGCTQTQTVSVAQISGPAANATASPSLITSGASSILTATGGGTYVWSPSADLSCTTCANPTATPSQTTSYCVLVTDNNGCQDSTCIIVTVDIPCGSIYIPNAFSPNNDSENDLECIFGNCIEIFHIAIYNRWGEKVFESSDQKICWDGTYKGKLLNTAVFDYYLEATLTSGEKVKRKGNVSLIK